MRKEFFAFIRPTDQEIKEVWKSCIFTFDANILLNFYRYTNETTSVFFQLLDKLIGKIQITHQACDEYFENRLNVISEQEHAYSEVKDALERNVEEPLMNARKHPHINDHLLNELTATTKKVKEELDLRSQEYAKKISNDDILERILKIFNSKVGKVFDEERLLKIYQEGEKRYNENIPPGFKDKKKGGIRQFGDLVLWHQMIELSKEHKSDLIFITDDEKDDWLHIHNGKTIGALPALQNEFFKLTGKKIYLYTASRFIEKAGEYLNADVAKQAIEEVRNLQEEKKLDSFSSFLADEEIDFYLLQAIHELENENGWADLAVLGFHLLKYTPINYKKLGFQSLRQFIESRNLFETKAIQKSPSAKAVDAVFVKRKPLQSLNLDIPNGN